MPRYPYGVISKQTVFENTLPCLMEEIRMPRAYAGRSPLKIQLREERR